MFWALYAYSIKLFLIGLKLISPTEIHDHIIQSLYKGGSTSLNLCSQHISQEKQVKLNSSLLVFDLKNNISTCFSRVPATSFTKDLLYFSPIFSSGLIKENIFIDSPLLQPPRETKIGVLFYSHQSYFCKKSCWINQPVTPYPATESP